MTDWISVDDRKPPKNKLVVTRFQPECCRTFMLEEHFEVAKGLALYGSRIATHWLLLPVLSD